MTVRHKNVASLAEVRFAQNFLRYLHGNWHNVYLVTAVVAWLRQEGGLPGRGNNPFNLRPGADDARFRSGIRGVWQSIKRFNPATHSWTTLRVRTFFSVYANLTDAARATANRLMSAGSDWRRYDRAVSAAQRWTNGTATGPHGEQQQAIDFLTGIAMSAWSSSHYGAADGNVSHNHLISVWQGITGISTVIPATPATKKTVVPAKKKTVRKTVRRRIPAPPRPLKPPTHMNNYLQPYEAAGFYNARHGRDDTLPVTGALELVR